MSERGARPTDLQYLTTWPGGSDLVRDYVRAVPEAVRFYGGHYADLAAYEAVADSVDARFDAASRERAARALRVSDDRGRARLGAWVSTHGLMVTTGQQPGLLTGPLFSVYKALTAIHLAHRLEAETGRPVLPVFWVASEDHDWAESGHAVVLNRFEESQRIEAVPQQAPADRALHRVLLEGGDALEESLTRWLPDTAFTPRWVDAARDAYAGASLADGMADLMLELLGPLGLCVCQAHDPAVKRASQPILDGELERSARHEAVLEGRCTALGHAGYSVQVPIVEDALNVFMEGPGDARERLYRTDAGLRLHQSGTQVSLSAAKEAVRAGIVSPNVLLRPLAESATFPTLAYVGGPGELAYFAELAPLFEEFGMRMPVLHPRVSVTAVPPKVRGILDKFDLTPEAVGVPRHELASRWAQNEMPPEVRRALEDWEESIGPHAAALMDVALSIDPTLEGPVTRSRNVAREGVERARAKILTAIKRNGEVSLSQLDRAQAWLHPGGAPQERVFSVYTFLARYGDVFIEELNDQVGRHVAAVHGTASVP